MAFPDDPSRDGDRLLGGHLAAKRRDGPGVADRLLVVPVDVGAPYLLAS